MNRVVVAHDPNWKKAFENEAEVIRSVLSQNCILLHHIGSTAIPNILAKPIIDLLGVVDHLEYLDGRTELLENLGYEAMGAFGIEGRRYFRKIDASGRRTHHLHIFEKGSKHIGRHLAFRDYLCCHPEKAEEYSALKAQLTDGETPTWEAYQDGKEPFISATEKDAVDWYRRTQPKLE